MRVLQWLFSLLYLGELASSYCNHYHSHAFDTCSTARKTGDEMLSINILCINSSTVQLNWYYGSLNCSGDINFTTYNVIDDEYDWYGTCGYDNNCDYFEIKVWVNESDCSKNPCETDTYWATKYIPHSCIYDDVSSYYSYHLDCDNHNFTINYYGNDSTCTTDAKSSYIWYPSLFGFSKETDCVEIECDISKSYIFSTD